MPGTVDWVFEHTFSSQELLVLESQVLHNDFPHFAFSDLLRLDFRLVHNDVVPGVVDVFLPSDDEESGIEVQQLLQMFVVNQDFKRVSDDPFEVHEKHKLDCSVSGRKLDRFVHHRKNR